MFKQVCLQLIPDFMQWSEDKGIVWKRVLCRWIQSLFTAMSKQCVNRLWSIVLFEGYGAFLPMIVSILMSNKQQLMGLIVATWRSTSWRRCPTSRTSRRTSAC